MIKLKKGPTALQSLAIGFAIIILVGTLLLMLPASNRDGQSIPFDSALFTATSATCVTGLIVYDTWTQFSMLGQAIILLLIQIGGLGFMTIAVLFAIILKKRIGLKERAYLKETVNSMQLAGVVRLSKRILIGTAIIELIGAALLSIRFIPQFGFGHGLWLSVFHAVSAFCNAGFDILGSTGAFSSLTGYVHDWLVCSTVMLLIIIGGIGFVVWDDLVEKKHHFAKYKLHTKVMLISTAVMIVGCAALLFFLERNNTMKDFTFSERILASLFHSVSPRTAGFESISCGQLTDGSSLVTMFAMLIGAGPGSTAGGLKISTLVVLILAVISELRKSKDMEIFGRRLENNAVHRAASSLAIFLGMILVGCLVLVANQNLSLHDALFECISAVGTVGLTRGITTQTTLISRLVLVTLMYAGRIGSLSIAIAFVDRRTTPHLRKPVDKIIVG